MPRSRKYWKPESHPYRQGLRSQAVNDSDVAGLIRRDGMQKTLEDVLRYLEPLKGEAYIDALHSDVARTLENYNCRYKSGRAK